MSARAPRWGERGLVRGCCLGLVVLLVLVGAFAYLVDRAVAAPGLGQAGGPSHGTSEQAIGVALAAQLVAELASNSHAIVQLSEQDLTVIAGANNPHPDRFRDVQARVRNGQVLVAAVTDEGPLSVTGVAYVQVSVDRSSGSPLITATVVRLDVGALTIPGFLRDRLLSSVAPTLALDQLFSSSAALSALRLTLDCVGVTQSSVVIGMHRPTVSADPNACGTGS